MKLALGTVQFGMNYGISNIHGQTCVGEVAEILGAAAGTGITLIDTAFLYGESEIILGKVLAGQAHAFQIVTKTIQFAKSLLTPQDAVLMRDSFFQSLQRLRQESVYGLLIHDADDLLCDGSEYLFAELNRLRQAGYVQKIGVSICSGEQIDRLLNRYAHIDIVQLPCNILDQRLIKGGYIKKIKAAGIEIHCRSVFLQGLLLMDLTDLPEFCNPIFPMLREYHQQVKKQGNCLLASALHFAKEIEEIDYIVVGVNTKKQLLENIKAYQANITSIDYSKFACRDENIINPSNWR